MRSLRCATGRTFIDCNCVLQSLASQLATPLLAVGSLLLGDSAENRVPDARERCGNVNVDGDGGQGLGREERWQWQ